MGRDFYTPLLPITLIYRKLFKMRIQAHIVTLSIPHNQAIYPTSNTIFTFFSITVKFPRFSYQSRQNIGKKVGKKTC